MKNNRHPSWPTVYQLANQAYRSMVKDWPLMLTLLFYALISIDPLF